MMSYLLSNICRLCASLSGSLVQIFNDDGSSDYSQKISNYLHLEIQGSWMWMRICRDCCDELDKWHNFVEKVGSAELFFNSLPQNQITSLTNDGDGECLPNEQMTEENSRLIKQKKKGRRKGKALYEADDAVEDLVDEVEDGVVVEFGVAEIRDVENNHDMHNNGTIRLKIRKIREDQSLMGVCNDVDNRSSDEDNPVESKKEQEELSSLKAETFLTEEGLSTWKDQNPVQEKCSTQGFDFANFSWDCLTCKAAHSSWSALARHCKLEHDEGAKVECMCGQILHSRSSVVKHHLKHTVGLKYKCDYENCGKTYVRKSQLDVHLLSHLPKDKQPWLCCKCSRRFHSEYLLKQHERLHLPSEEKSLFPCNICEKKLCSKSAVASHIRSVHLGERPFVCDQCGLSFASKGILAEHLTIHSDVFNHHCQDCGKSFKTKYRLRIHMDTHLQTRYACPVCELTLNTRRTLRMHLLVHQDRKSFCCDTCGKAFKRSKDLKNHRNLHTGRRPYSCTFCPRTFANGSNCRSHKRRMHPVELEQYEIALSRADRQSAINEQIIADVADEEQIILKEDVLMVARSEELVKDEVELEKEDDTDTLTDNFSLQSVHSFQSTFPCIPPLSASSFLFRP